MNIAIKEEGNDNNWWWWQHIISIEIMIMALWIIFIITFFREIFGSPGNILNTAIRNFFILNFKATNCCAHSHKNVVSEMTHCDNEWNVRYATSFNSQCYLLCDIFHFSSMLAGCLLLMMMMRRAMIMGKNPDTK